MKADKKGQFDLSGNEDLGFKSFKLTQSNFTEWQPTLERDTSQLELRFTQAESPLVPGWTPEALLTEILLLQGFPLDSRARPLAEFQSNRVLEITSEFCQHRLYVCLDEKIQPETVQAFKLRPEDILVTLDSALSDEAKIRLADQVNLQVI
jgi:adenine-specific DNA-methyltransferase